MRQSSDRRQQRQTNGGTAVVQGAVGVEAELTSSNSAGDPPCCVTARRVSHLGTTVTSEPTDIRRVKIAYNKRKRDYYLTRLSVSVSVAWRLSTMHPRVLMRLAFRGFAPARSRRAHSTDHHPRSHPPRLSSPLLEVCLWYAASSCERSRESLLLLGCGRRDGGRCELGACRGRRIHHRSAS